MFFQLSSCIISCIKITVLGIDSLNSLALILKLAFATTEFEKVFIHWKFARGARYNVKKEVNINPTKEKTRIGLRNLLELTPKVLNAVTSASEDMRLSPASIPISTDIGTVNANTEGIR